MSEPDAAVDVAVDSDAAQAAGADAQAPTPGSGASAAVPPVGDASADEAGSVLDWISELARRSPQVRQAQALQRIAAAMGAGASPSTIVEALAALDDLGCYSNQETCLRVCQWARLNCDACDGQTGCTDAISASCVIGCSP